MERRLEGLVYQEKDARRHVSQALIEFRKDIAGDKGAQVLDGWIFEVARGWLQARNWIKDVPVQNLPNEWKKICRGAVEDAMQHVENLQWQAKEITKAGGNIKEVKELQDTFEAVKFNLEVCMKECKFINLEPCEAKYEAEVMQDVLVALTLQQQ